MFDLYLTSTFRHPWNRQFNPRLAQALEAKGLRCYAPHRDTDQNAGPAEVFRQDLAGLTASKIVLAVAENESPNWGAEVGYAFALKKPIIALAHSDHQIPLILNGMMSRVVRTSDLNELATYVDELTGIVRVHI